MSHKTHLLDEMSTVPEVHVGKSGARGSRGGVFNFHSFWLLFSVILLLLNSVVK